MELQDYRANAFARQAETARRFRQAEAMGLTRIRPDQRASRWSGAGEPRTAAPATTITASAGPQHGN